MLSVFLYYLASILALVFVLVPHEFAHALAAHLNGDLTPKYNGRLTLNPVKHFDLMGFVMCALVGFGWAKPVPINTENFRHYKWGLFSTAIAGVLTNYILAFIFYPLAVLSLRLGNNPGYEFLQNFLYMVFAYNLSIAVFNLLPLFPLDGFRVIESLTKPWNKVRQFLERYGQMILMILVFESFLCRIAANINEIFSYFNILGYVMTFAVNIIGWPIKALWGLIL